MAQLHHWMLQMTMTTDKLGVQIKLFSSIICATFSKLK
jgi:hypothetical protein